jgi:hypothetical protein
MKVIVSRTGDWGPDDRRNILARMCEDFVDSIAASPELSVPESYPAVRLVLSGAAEAHKWGVEADSIGFFAVMSPRQYDDEDVDEENPWFDVNESLEVHLNMDVAAGLFEHVSRDDMRIELEAWLVTSPHELLHVADWMKATEGRTPIEVFDAGKGEFEVAAVLKKIEKTYADAGLDIEDEIEMTGLDITRRVTNEGHSLETYADDLAALDPPRNIAVCH